MLYLELFGERHTDFGLYHCTTLTWVLVIRTSDLTMPPGKTIGAHWQLTGAPGLDFTERDRTWSYLDETVEGS